MKFEIRTSSDRHTCLSGCLPPLGWFVNRILSPGHPPCFVSVLPCAPSSARELDAIFFPWLSSLRAVFRSSSSKYHTHTPTVTFFHLLLTAGPSVHVVVCLPPGWSLSFYFSHQVSPLPFPIKDSAEIPLFLLASCVSTLCLG